MVDKNVIEYEKPEMIVFPGYAKLVCGTSTCSADENPPPPCPFLE